MILLLICFGLAGEQEYRRGLDLVKLKRFDEADAIFRDGRRQCPSDKRFSLGLAGLEYLRRDYAAAKSHLKRALQLDVADAYANDFLATLFFLDGNLEGALKFWNRAGKPKTENVLVEPASRQIDPVLLDRAIAFAPASVLTLPEYRNTLAWLDLLDMPATQRIELAPREEGSFDVRLHLVEPDGWARKIAWLRSLPFQAMHADFRNINGDAVNWTNMVRWDRNKQRFLTELAAPVMGNPRRRLRAYGDARKELWNTGDGEFRLEKIAAGLEFMSVPSSRFSWRTGMQLSSERLWNAPKFPQGVALKYRTGLDWVVLNIPEQRLSINGGALLEIGKVFASSRALFSRVRFSLDGRWFPSQRGTDYETRVQIRAGKGFGALPLDELFILGAERDNDLWLRGHSGTRNGQKGHAPMGAAFLLANLEVGKRIYSHPLFTIQLGPFADIGRIRDLLGRPSPSAWIVDPGVHARIRLLGKVEVSLSYGWNVSSGRGLFYSKVEH
ncbi:MAG: tetratricopeptide repeat protein [Bryobacteraceae bacterium]